MKVIHAYILVFTNRMMPYLRVGKVDFGKQVDASASRINAGSYGCLYYVLGHDLMCRHLLLYLSLA